MGRKLGGALLAITAGCTPTGGKGVERGALVEQRPPPAAAGKDRGDGLTQVAVVELFTSEGCSSCPPADDVLRELPGAANELDPRVITLSFHVDYWNELGWPDPFSSARSTARQRVYARAFGGSGLYTPQMIVGGRDQFVGSDRAQARRSVNEALSREASAKVALQASSSADERELEVGYNVEGAPENAVLVVALVEDGLVVAVPRGENAGRTLRHESVVRVFETVRLTGAPGEQHTAGSVRLSAPRRTGSGKRALVGYVQKADLEIVGAARLRLDGA